MKNKVLFLLLMACLPLFVNGQSAEEWFNKGLDTTDYTEKLRCFDKAVELGYIPLVHAYNNRGNANQYLGRYTEAIADYDIAIQLDPKYKDTYYNRGCAKQDLGKYAEAIADYDIVIQLRGGHNLKY